MKAKKPYDDLPVWRQKLARQREMEFEGINQRLFWHPSSVLALVGSLYVCIPEQWEWALPSRWIGIVPAVVGIVWYCIKYSQVKQQLLAKWKEAPPKRKSHQHEGL